MKLEKKKFQQQWDRLPDFIKEPDPSIYLRDNYVVLDFETTNLEKGDALNKDNRLVLAVWVVVKDGKSTGKWSWLGEAKQKRLIDDIKAADFIVAHNAKFELQWLRRCGLSLRDVLVWDTQIAEYVIAGNRKLRLDLSSCAKRYGLDSKESLVSKMIQAGVCPSKIPQKWLIHYCKKDVDLTWDLFKGQIEDLADSKLLNVVYTRCLLTPCLADIEFNGATLDGKRVRDRWAEAERELADIDVVLEEISDGANLNSSHQLAHFLYTQLKFKELRRFGRVDRNLPNKQFPDGMPKTDVGTITKLVCRTQKQRRAKELLLKRSKIAAALSKNLEFFRAVCEDYDGKFYAQFNQTVTGTHRLSASGRKVFDRRSNKDKSSHFQNFPRDLKNLFCPRAKDRFIGEDDSSQLEFRGAGHLGRDEQIREDVINDEDIHAVTARALTEAGEPTSRQDAKSSTFKPLYGGQYGSPAVMAYCELFRKKYKGVADAQLRWADEALATGKVETEWGLVFYYPGTKLKSDGNYTNFTIICNYPVQSFSTAEIIPVSLVYFWHLIEGLDILIINTVHDSIVSDIHKDCVDQYCELSAYSMMDCASFYLKQVYNIDLFVPLGCGIKIGHHWNEPININPPEYIAGYKVKTDKNEIKLDAHRREE